MTIENMTSEETKYWIKGCRDTLDEIATRGLWICPECGHLMDAPPKDYHICDHCEKEFGYDAKEVPDAVPLWMPKIDGTEPTDSETK